MAFFLIYALAGRRYRGTTRQHRAQCPASTCLKRERVNLPRRGCRPQGRSLAGLTPLSKGSPQFTMRPLEAARLVFLDSSLAYEKRKRPWPGPLRPSSKSASASRSTAICRPSSDPQLSSTAIPVNGAPDRHRTRCCGRRRFSAMELSVSGLPSRLDRRPTRKAAHPSKPRRHR
jgi:hypothetical protein